MSGSAERSAFLTSSFAPMATGWSDSFAGRDLRPLETAVLARRTLFLPHGRFSRSLGRESHPVS